MVKWQHTEVFACLSSIRRQAVVGLAIQVETEALLVAQRKQNDTFFATRLARTLRNHARWSPPLKFCFQLPPWPACRSNSQQTVLVQLLCFAASWSSCFVANAALITLRLLTCQMQGANCLARNYKLNHVCEKQEKAATDKRWPPAWRNNLSRINLFIKPNQQYSRSQKALVTGRGYRKLHSGCFTVQRCAIFIFLRGRN